ncbi:hypothetical protein [Terrisporobacter mayombei]|nr:hypothetical protein [Terrisporobacter mayombei]MCC3668058.1 hypothetical protein [Terrisporobacter mayombei]
MKSKKIEQVLMIANVYIEEGMTYSDAVKKAEIEVSKLEREKYESKI